MVNEHQLWQAIHMLHEQAHGPVAMVTCTEEPCRLLSRDTYGSWPANAVPDGPAPLSFPKSGDNH